MQKLEWWRSLSRIGVLLLLVGSGGALIGWLSRQSGSARWVRPVPSGDQEIAWLHTPTAYETWDNFVRGLKRAEGSGRVPQLYVDDRHAYPQQTTAVPEVIVGRSDRVGRLHFRWYKVTDAMSQSRWIEQLLQRQPPPLAVIAGWSSDRAAELAEALRASPQPDKPVLILVAATAEQISSDVAMTGPAGPLLVSLYERTFRFCFSNRQMAEALVDFLLTEPSLRPHSGIEPATLAWGGGWRDPWGTLTALLAPEIPAFAIDWQDDPYSLDLSFHLRRQLSRRCPTAAGVPHLLLMRSQIPFSTGPVHQPNAAEADAVAHILQHLPPSSRRTLLLLPTVTAPARRVLRALVQEQSEIGEQLVAVIGDGITVNTVFRDREVAWPIRTIPVPLVLFTHADPFAWDDPQTTVALPRDYTLPAPAATEVRTTTEDVEHFRWMSEVLVTAAYSAQSPALVANPEQLHQALRSLEPAVFDAQGNRLGGRGEHIVVLRPLNMAPFQSPDSEGVIEVYTRQGPERGWFCLHRRLLYRISYERSP
ncbi:MAG: hypothetical protein NZU63_08280 [Gemmataceae bacterium]|nr:hypothetical protein [Gemmataceae bacterium]